MSRPIVGIIGNMSLLNDSYPVHAGGTMNSAAVAQVAGCMPLLIPTDPRFVGVEELLEACHGFLLTGGRPNVHPSEYGEEETEAHGAFDRCRDAITLPLVRACVDRGQPFLGICRGFQEVNVAMGGTLHPEIRDLPGRMTGARPTVAAESASWTAEVLAAACPTPSRVACSVPARGPFPTPCPVRSPVVRRRGGSAARRGSL